MAYYSELCDRHGLAEQSEQAHRAYRQMAEWRVAHRDQCEDPDRVQPPRPDLARVHWQVCRNCGTIFQELTLRCPACRHEHTEARDEGPRPLERDPDRDGTRARLAATHLAGVRRGVGANAGRAAREPGMSWSDANDASWDELDDDTGEPEPPRWPLAPSGALLPRER